MIAALSDPKEKRVLRFDIMLLIILTVFAIWTEVDKYLKAED